MLCVPISDAAIQEERAAALADAGYTHEQVRFFALPGLGISHVGASWFRPHQDIEPGDRAWPGNDAQRAEANSNENRDLHRIAIAAAPEDRATFAALVRHELEHARQWDAMLAIFDLQDFIEHDVLPEVVGGLDGCQAGALINTIPTEMDCNAAASVYISKRFSAAEVQAIRDSDRRPLACSLLPPPPPETLPARMVAFAFVHLSAVEAHAARRGFPVASIVRMYSARELWERLEQGL
ncbi:MAG: hypothetical protein JWR63_1749 [Conexibacter sp.]|nr:hypothetical protein [Conexibacter sp.]